MTKISTINRPPLIDIDQTSPKRHPGDNPVSLENRGSGVLLGLQSRPSTHITNGSMAKFVAADNPVDDLEEDNQTIRTTAKINHRDVNEYADKYVRGYSSGGGWNRLDEIKCRIADPELYMAVCDRTLLSMEEDGDYNVKAADAIKLNLIRQIGTLPKSSQVPALKHLINRVMSGQCDCFGVNRVMYDMERTKLFDGDQLKALFSELRADINKMNVNQEVRNRRASDILNAAKKHGMGMYV